MLEEEHYRLKKICLPIVLSFLAIPAYSVSSGGFEVGVIASCSSCWFLDKATELGSSAWSVGEVCHRYGLGWWRN